MIHGVLFEAHKKSKIKNYMHNTSQNDRECCVLLWLGMEGFYTGLIFKFSNACEVGLAPSQYNNRLPRYGISIIKISYLDNGNPYTGEMGLLSDT